MKAADCCAGITQCTVKGDKKQNTQPAQSRRFALLYSLILFFLPMSLTMSPRATIATEITPVSILNRPIPITIVASVLLRDLAKRLRSEPISEKIPLLSITPINENTPISIHTVPTVPVIAAESGTGKSHLINELSKIVPNMTVTDSSSMTASGYRGGNHVTTILNKVDITSKDPSFVVLDEFNRLLDKGLKGWSDTSLLAELLVLFDDKDVQVNVAADDKQPIWVNPKNIFFVLLGSFSDITDQKSSNSIGFNADIKSSVTTHRPQITKDQILDHLSQWPELIGRISRIIINPNMTEKDYLSMLKDFRYSPVSKLGQDLGINIIVSPQKMRAWAKNAYESGTGLRGVKNHLLEEVDKALFNNPNVKEINIR